MFQRCWFLLALCLFSSWAHAQNEIFLCVDEQGNRTYQNVGTGKGCRKLELQPLNTVPASKPNNPGNTGANVGNPGQRGVTTGGGSSNFPRVDTSSQRVRDEERRRILQEELKSEEQKLGDLRKEFNNGEPERRGDERNYQKYLDRVQKIREDIARSEANIEGLKRELRNIPPN
ncbi:DUF4124 domain-containing protein [Parvibium lacunae]|uniref:DUF4124 domain-containing protein n=2 Tax=Parvibium lacunae TaxID=1888893 RepID=A0A368L7J3_9BURK|nr:DUF4124 domain-containing protein [Parvibium lacunae]